MVTETPSDWGPDLPEPEMVNYPEELTTPEVSEARFSCTTYKNHFHLLVSPRGSVHEIVPASAGFQRDTHQGNGVCHQ